MATHEFVVPRSMPITFSIVAIRLSLLECQDLPRRSHVAYDFAARFSSAEMVPSCGASCAAASSSRLAFEWRPAAR